jgi:hypothetical protein
VQVDQRWILARLRNHCGAERSHQNTRQTSDFGASRAELFAELDKSKLTKLADRAYALVRRKRCRGGPGYHAEIDGRRYSAPFRLIRELVNVRVDDRTVGISSIRASGSPATPARPVGGATPQSPTTRPAPIAATANGRPPE